jgi:hypothetical protein
MRKLTITLLILLSSMIAFSQTSQTKVLCEFDNKNIFLITISDYGKYSYLTFEGDEDSKFTNSINSFTEKDDLFTVKVDSKEGYFMYYFNVETNRFTIKTPKGETYNGNILAID